MSARAKDHLPVLADFPDWQSPMVVKELRHGLRTRFFSVALIKFHALLVLLMSSVLVGADQEVVHGVFWALALVLLLVVMPLRGFGAVRNESAGGTLDMLALTDLNSLRIIYGKWAALFSQALLVGSSLLPYMVARYFLGGVEIVAEATALTLAVLASAVITAAIVAFSTQKPVLLRLLLLASVMVPLLPFAGFLVVGIMGNNSDLMNEFPLLPGWKQAALVGGVLMLAVCGTYLFLALGASRFASRAENHSTTKRLVGLAVMTVLGVVGTSLGLSGSNDEEMWCLFPALVIALVLGMDVMTEAMPSVPTAIQGGGGWWRHFAGRLLYPGWASGVLYYALICVSPLMIAGTETIETGEEMFVALAACILAANVVPVVLPVLSDKPFMRWWVVQLSLMTVGLLVMILADVANVNELGWVGVVTPGTALMACETVEYAQRDGAVMTGAVFGGLWVLAALVTAVGQMNVYRDLESQTKVLEQESAGQPTA
jgi:hypothetical protein